LKFGNKIIISISSEAPKYQALQIKLCDEKFHADFKDLKILFN